MIYDIPGYGKLQLNTLVLDLNGTLSIGGEIQKGIKEQLSELSDSGFNIVLFTGNTRGDAEDIAYTLEIDWVLAKTASEKRDQALKYDPKTTVSIGNGLIDLELMKIVALSIVTVQGEGAHIQTLINSDIVVPSIKDALDLLIDKQRLIATLRK